MYTSYHINWSDSPWQHCWQAVFGLFAEVMHEMNSPGHHVLQNNPHRWHGLQHAPTPNLPNTKKSPSKLPMSAESACHLLDPHTRMPAILCMRITYAVTSKAGGRVPWQASASASHRLALHPWNCYHASIDKDRAGRNPLQTMPHFPVNPCQ